MTLKEGSRDFLRSLRPSLGFVEGCAVLCACLWLVGLTLHAVSGSYEARWGVGYFLVGIAVLGIASSFRRDVRRLRYLVGPFALLAYSVLLMTFSLSALAKGHSAQGIGPAAFAAGVLFVLALWWIQRGEDRQKQASAAD